MTHPSFAPPAQGPGGLPPGYRSLPGGYDQAVAQAHGQPQQQQPYLTQLGQPAQQALGPSMPPFMEGNLPVPPPPQQQVQQQQAAPQQQWAGPGPQPGVPAQYQGQFQSQPVPQQVDLNQRLQGPNVPPELQGRTVGEVIALHDGLRRIHLAQIQQGGQQPAPQSQPQVPQGAAAPQANGQPGWDWRDPRKSTLSVFEEFFEQRIAPMLAPMVQNNTLQSMTSARNAAAAEIGPQLFAAIEPQLMQRLQGIDPRALQNAETWKIAAAAIVGDNVIRQQRGTQQPAQQGGMIPQQQMVAPGANPLPNLGTFFSEQPNQGGPGAQGVQLSAEQRWAAQQMGMAEADYAAWSGGAPGGVR